MKTEIIPLRGEDKIVVASEDDLQDHVDACQALRSLPQKSDWGRHIASIPPIMVTQALHEAWHRGWNVRWTDKEFFNKVILDKLRNGEWAKFRTDK